MMSTEFNKVFTELEAPDYPATCDQCGVEGTNASMEEHVCDESPASLLDTAIYAEDINKRISARVKIVKQYTALIEQRERLLRLLRPVTSPTACYCAVMKGEKCWHCEARELIATIEQETGVK